MQALRTQHPAICIMGPAAGQINLYDCSSSGVPARDESTAGEWTRVLVASMGVLPSQAPAIFSGGGLSALQRQIRQKLPARVCCDGPVLSRAVAAPRELFAFRGEGWGHVCGVPAWKQG